MWSILSSLLLVFLLQEIRSEKVNKNILNEEVLRLIDITTSIVKSIYEITLKNFGTTNVETYLFELQDDQALVSFTNGINRTLFYQSIKSENYTAYVINLDKSLFLNDKYKLRINIIHPSKLLPTNKFSRYDEEHSFMWRGNGLFYSQYPTRNYRLMFLTNPSYNRNIETSVMYDSTNGKLFIFRRRNLRPLSYEEIILTFTTPLPSLKVKNLNRSIFVSKFGKIMVEDQISVENAGPKLQGPYFNNQSEYWMFTHLPPSAEGVTLSDVIGKNFKWHLFEKDDSKSLKFIPRYSLRQGGWKSSYILQYNVPVYEYIFRYDNHYYLKIRAMDHILNDVMVEEADVKIILPDGASLVRVVLPAGFERGNTTTIYTSLSVSGRVVVNLRGRLLIEEHINDVIVKYRFSMLSFLSAPLYIVFMLEAILFLIILLRKYSDK